MSSNSKSSTRRAEVGWRLFALLPFILLSACGPEPLKPALRDDIVFDAGRYQAFMQTLSVNTDAAWFIDQTRWQALATPSPGSLANRAAPRPLTERIGDLALIYNVAQDEGVDPAYMLGLARRESGFDSYARARTSSAGGLFQFTSGTWLCSLRLYGADLGIGEAANILRGHDGRCSVVDPADRFYLLSLRFNADVSTKIAARHTLDNQRFLKGLGRIPSHADLYALHFLGPGAGQDFLSAPADALGYQVVPRAAQANPAVFWRHGRPLRIWEIYRDFGNL